MKWDNYCLMVRDTSEGAAMSARKGLRTVAIGLAMLAALAGGVAHADFIVVPNLAGQEGNTGNAFPFSIFGQGQGSTGRYQQVFAASEFGSLGGPVCITEIAFRPNADPVKPGNDGRAFDVTLPKVQINLSTTDAAPDALSPFLTFDENVGADDTAVVHDGQPPPGPRSLDLSSLNKGPDEGPRDFDIIIEFDTPFFYDRNAGNLLLDVRNFSAQLTTQFDAHFEQGDSISRVANLDVNDPSINQNFTSTTGLVTRFTVTPGECTGSEQPALIVDLDPDVIEFTVVPYENGEELVEQFITAYIKLPDGVNPEEIDTNDVILMLRSTDVAAADSFVVGNLLFVKFPATPVVSDILGIEKDAVKKVEVDVTKNLIKVVATEPTDLAQPNDLIELAVSVESFGGTDAVLVIQNRPPVADAGEDQTVECAFRGRAVVRLDASGSSDPDGDPLTFTWTGPFGTLTGKHVKTKLPLGEHSITMTVDDGRGGMASDVTVVTVGDSRGPTIKRITASPKVLWPPNHRMVPVTVSASVSDACHVGRHCRIYAVSSNEPPGHKEPDWKFTEDLTLKLRARRSGKGNGRVYEITLRCTDSSGNGSTKSVTVSVPHDRGEWKDKIDEVKEKIKHKLNEIKKKQKH